jgi:dipeptidyl aminopeptidase/acylaminoacyl peptidase
MKVVVAAILLITCFLLGWVAADWENLRPGKLPVAGEFPDRPLEKYTIENLGKREYGSEIFLDEVTSTTSAYTAYKFHFDSDGRIVTGLAYIPKNCGKCPVVVQFRGYAEVEKYYQGYGTKHSAEMFAANGFISLAPDFLGYGGSASPSANVWEARFETYTTALNLLAAISRWSLALPAGRQVDSNKIGIWGHSNGGQIALAVLEISGKPYPTVLWAPVSAPFPYSVLYYTDDIPDRGKLLRKELADFEQDYDVEQFNLLNYLDRITGILQIHQGTADESVPVRWTNRLVENLKAENKEVKYFIYSEADHNLVPDWSLVVDRDVSFFRQSLGLTR